jgi:hypothetical protein
VVETVGGGLERAVRGGSVRPESNGGGGAVEQLRSGELPMSMWSLMG